MSTRKKATGRAAGSASASAAGIVWPRVPLDVATGPDTPYPWFDKAHVGRRIAPAMASEDGALWLSVTPPAYVYYPPAPITDDEAAALGERLRAGIQAAAMGALDATLDDADPEDTPPAAIERAMDAVRAYLDTELGPAPDPKADETDTFARVYLLALMAEAAAELRAELAARREAEETATILDRVQLLPFSTAPWAGGLRTGYANAGADRYEIVPLERGSGVVTAESARGQLRFARAPSAGAVGETYPGMSPDEARALAAALKKDGRLKGALIAQAAVQFTVLHPYELVTWDDRFRLTFGWKRPGSRPGQDRDTVLADSRRAFDRLLYSRLQIGASGEHVGRAFSHGEEAIGERELYRMGYRQRDAEGLPLRVRFDPVGVSADILHNPGRSESLGYLNDILALPETAPGRWATALIAFLSEYFRRQVNEAGKCWQVARVNGAGQGLSFGTVTRALVFDSVPPDPPQTPAELLQSASHGDRAPEHFTAAVRLLVDADLLDDCVETPTPYAEKHGREPWPHKTAEGKRESARRGVDWREAWRRQAFEPRPGGTLLGALLEQKRNRTRGLNQGPRHA